MDNKMEPIEGNQQAAPGNQEPQVTPQKSKKMIAIFIAIILLLLILLLIARYFMGGRNEQQTISIKPTQPINYISPSSVQNIINSPQPSEIISQTDTPTPTQIPGKILPLPVWIPSSVQLNDPNLLVQGYYNWYLACEKQYFANNDPSNSRETCKPFRADVLIGNLISLLQNVKGHDPVLCAQNIPQAITYEKAVTTNTHATAIVHTHWGAPSINDITVGLDIENGAWKISSINCSSN